MNASDITQNIFFQFSNLFFLFHLNFFQIFIFFIIIISFIASITCIVFFYLFFCQNLFIVQLLLWIIWIIFFVIHCVVNICTFVIEQLGKRDHCCIFEIFSKTSSDQMRMNPLNIFQIDCIFFKKLGIFCTYFNKLLTLFEKFFSLILDSYL
jgi:hypothetical protein